MIFACTSLVEGFCSSWVEIDAAQVAGASEISGSPTGLTASEIAEAFTLGFLAVFSLAVIAYCVRMVVMMMFATVED